MWVSMTGLCSSREMRLQGISKDGEDGLGVDLGLSLGTHILKARCWNQCDDSVGRSTVLQA